MKSPTSKGGKTRKPRKQKALGSRAGSEPFVKRILEEGKHHFDLVFSGNPLARSKVEMIRKGDSWTRQCVNEKVVTIISDGNGLNVTHHDNDGINDVRLEYHEAFDLAIALLEYTKSDKNMPIPAYEVI